MSARRVAVAWSALVVGPALASMPTFTLNNGVAMPVLSYGANLYDSDTCKQATGYALQAGFRFIWSSMLIGDACQLAQSRAIDESGIPRGELFLAGTVNTQTCADFDACYQETKSLGENQLRILSDPKLDMLMLDYPSGAGCQGILGQWKAFEELYQAEKTRVIAVSNFGPEELQCLMGSSPVVVPAVNQMQENAGKPGAGMVVADNAKFGITVQAYSPLGTGGLASDALLKQIGQAHGKSSIQVALRWLIQRGIAANLASTSLQHLTSDIQIFDFTLSDAEMQEITKHAQDNTVDLAQKVSVAGVGGVTTLDTRSMALRAMPFLLVGMMLSVVVRAGLLGRPAVEDSDFSLLE